MGIIGRITSDIRLMLQRPPRQQFAAICHRRRKKTNELEVLVITSRDTGRWVIPKGWHMPGKQPHAIAEREAYEEAGIKGKAERDPIGSYGYMKKMNGGLKVPTRVQVYSLLVKSMLKDFPEKGSRRLEWVTCEEAANRVDEPELKALFRAFPRLLQSQAENPKKSAEVA
ncbi:MULTISPECIES: NUDIX hydrolase [unclassified Rhizobium]|uniref:NUDIX hydrolase n=1 Tax=unclassified Rhizobium TaxID=2613769 RepID=UPI000AF687C2|nr:MULTISPECIES: NUDIX hydrolase [unclassified Rhizobium]